MPFIEPATPEAYAVIGQLASCLICGEKMCRMWEREWVHVMSNEIECRDRDGRLY